MGFFLYFNSCNNFEELIVSFCLFHPIAMWKVALFLTINQSPVLLLKSNQEVPRAKLFSLQHWQGPC